ncbi:MAG: leucine-rich repeat domain-containing protein [Clostridia bacterium]|nr:leucine-rich repeat domain-containing protein [Clostridia bacterium]
MNKIKLGVGLILIVLCVAVLGIGIYAAASSTSTITGTITVNSACPEVKISAYQGSYNPASPSTNRLGTPIEKRNGSGTIGLGTFSMNEDEVYKSIYAESVIQIIVVIENHSFDQELGVYFWKDANNGGDGTIDKNTNSSDPEYGCVLYSDILYGHHTYGSGNVIDIEYEFYKMVPCATDVNSNGVFNSGTDAPGREVIRMYLRMNAIPDQQVVFNFNVNLNIENYVPNYTTTSANQKVFTKVGSSNLIDHPDYDNKKMSPTTWNSSVRYIVLPSQTDYVGWSESVSGSCFPTALLAVSFPTSDSAGYSLCDGCTSLASVFLPYGCTMIEENAFETCSALTTIFFENTINTMYSYAFYGCSALTSVVIPGGVSTVSENLFECCTDLVYVILRSGVGSIGICAFMECQSLEYVYIPSSVTGIYGGTEESLPFGGCPASLVIDCGSASKPAGWSSRWNYIDDDNYITPNWSVSEPQI